MRIFFKKMLIWLERIELGMKRSVEKAFHIDIDLSANTYRVVDELSKMFATPENGAATTERIFACNWEKLCVSRGKLCDGIMAFPSLVTSRQKRN